MVGETDGKLPISTDGSDPATWDPKLEAMTAAPHNHTLLYEDENVRVISVLVPPGSEEPYHFHKYYSVLVVDRHTHIEDREASGKPGFPVFIESLHSPLVITQPPQALHSIKNLDTKPAHLTRIEFKHGFPPPVVLPKIDGRQSRG